ncbi:MAG: HD domain-containing protein [Deltaproteobacteria bacterium]|nr:HD domain-containing protein [Deltaproteobacteria bacterium]
MTFVSTDFPRHAGLWPLVEAVLDSTDLAHDADHIARVYRWALRLAPEAGADGDLAGAAALVHDLVNVPKEHEQRADAGHQSAQAAAPLLKQAGYRDDEVAQIADVVATSSWSCGQSPRSPLAKVLQDADRLDAIGAIGIARTFVCAQGIHGRGRRLRLHQLDDVLAQGERQPDDRRFALDHFQTKLLKLADRMHLPSARQEAQRRQQAMLDFLSAFEREASAR